MPLAITLGYASKGRDAEPVVLYCGLDAGKAKDLANAPGPGFARAEFIKSPVITARRFFDAAPVAEAAAPAPVAEEIPAEEPAPAPSGKKK